MQTDANQSGLFAGKGVSFPEIVGKGALGGRKAVRDYLQMRSSQLIRQLRGLSLDDANYPRIRAALNAISEASRLIDVMEQAEKSAKGAKPS